MALQIHEWDLRSVLSENIRRLRNRREWSQMKLAEKLGISTNFLSDIENCKVWVSSSTLAKLASALDVQVYELFKPEDKGDNSSNDERMKRLVQDITIALNNSVNEAMNQSLKNISKQYFETQNNQYLV